VISSMSSKIVVFESGLKKIGIWFNWVALGALATMLGLITADIVGAKFFRHPVPGAMDMVSLLGAILTAFSATETQIQGRHIDVDFLVVRLSSSLQKALACVKDFVCSALFAVVVWRCFRSGYTFAITGEVSPTQRIPLAPFAYAIALACVPMFLVFMVAFYRSLRSIIKK
jgi:TRAP-type C4-dicarboxylate transport system permease small subunit